MGDRAGFRPASSIPGLAAAFEAERRRILAAVPGAEVIHTGASSIPTLLTRGDLDIHVRVAGEEFDRARAALERTYTAYRRGMWTDAFAAFSDAAREPPVGVALTVLGAEHDVRFMKGWQRLRDEPELVDELNTLKKRHAGGDEAAYEADKSAFFDRIAETGRSPADQRRK